MLLWLEKVKDLIRIEQLWQKLAAAFLFVGACYAIYLTASIFLSLEKELKAAIIAAFVAFGVALLSSSIQKRRELEFKIRERKTEAYQKVFDFLLFLLKSMRNDSLLGDTETVVSRIHDVNYALLVWGSAETIKAWQELFQRMRNQNLDQLDKPNLTLNTLVTRNMIADVILVIRKDLGHVDRGIDFNVIADIYMPLNFTAEDWQMVREALNQAGPATK